MNTFYNWKYNYAHTFWFKNYYINDNKIHRFVTIYCDEVFQVQFHRSYRVFQDIFGKFYPPHSTHYNPNELLYCCEVDFLKNKVDQFLDKISKILVFI